MGVYERKDSKYWWMWLEGTDIRKSTRVPVGVGNQRKDSRRAAEEIYNALMGDLARGIFKLPKTRASITFRAHAEWYRDHVAAHHRGKRRAVSMIKQLIAHFGDRPLHEIDANAIEEWKATRAATVQKPTVNRELDILKPLLGKAVPAYLDRNPADGVRRFPTRRFPPITILSERDEAALLDTATPQERAFVLLGLDALMRLGDVRKLTVGQFHGGYIDVPNSKTGEAFQAPASRRLQEALKDLPNFGGFYFATKRKRGPKKGEWRAWSEAEAFKVFTRLCDRAGVTHGRESGGITYSSLRHTGASRATRATKLTAVMKLGGWASLRQLARYDHPDEPDLIRGVEAIGGSHPAHSKKQKRKNPPISGRV